MAKNKKIKVDGKSKDTTIPVHVLSELEIKAKQQLKVTKSPINNVRASRPKDSRQVTHNLRRRMGR